MKIIKFLLLASLFFIVGCSATKETSDESTSTEPQSVYVFDDVSSTEATSTAAAEVTLTEASKEETKPASEIASKDSSYTFDFESNEETGTTFQLFIVQLGAFSTLGKAETFVSNTKDKTNYEMTIHFSDKVNLHVVQLTPFRTREKADEVRDDLRKIKEFNGAFIVPNNK